MPGHRDLSKPGSGFGLHAVARSGDLFVCYDPDGIRVRGRRLPHITVVTGDRDDAASRLDRDAASFPVNLGLSRPAP